MNKPELISFSDPLMLSPMYDQRQFFAPEIEHLKGGVEGLLKSGLFSEDDEDSLIEYRGNVAIITIEGPMRPGRDWYYSTGYGDIQDAIVELIDNGIVKTVIQRLKTPGGTVAEAFETEEMFRELAKEKRLISFIEMATSAGSLMTFPAHERYISSKTAHTGSVGVVAEHIDNRAWYLEMWGEVRTSVAKGRLKDAGTDTQPYNEKAKEFFESSINKLHGIFVDSAVIGLNKTREQIEAQESRVYYGDDGIKEGFADGFATLSELIDQSEAQTLFSTPGSPAFSTHSQETITMEPTEYKTKYPDKYQAIVDIGRAEGSTALKEIHVAEGQGKGILLERKRMNDIDALSLPPKFATKAKSEDWSAEHAASEYLKAEVAKRKKTAANMETDLSDPLASDVPAKAKDPEGEKAKAKDPVVEYEAAVTKAMDGGKVTRGQAMKVVKISDPKLHAAFIKKSNKREL